MHNTLHELLLNPDMLSDATQGLQQCNDILATMKLQTH